MNKIGLKISTSVSILIYVVAARFLVSVGVDFNGFPTFAVMVCHHLTVAAASYMAYLGNNDNILCAYSQEKLMDFFATFEKGELYVVVQAYPISARNIAGFAYSPL